MIAHRAKVVVIATRTLPSDPDDGSLSTRVTHNVLMLVPWGTDRLKSLKKRFIILRDSAEPYRYLCQHHSVKQARGDSELKLKSGT